MRIDRIELRTLNLPIVTPFTTSFGTQTVREVMMVHVQGPDVDGWGECVTLAEPIYSPEYTAGAREVIRRWLGPMLLSAEVRTARDVAPALEHVVGHRMAKGALEMAVLDAELRAQGRSFAEHLGVQVDRVPSGVSVGIVDSVPELVEVVGDYLEQGYVRIKLKIKPGWDLEPVRAVREAYGDIPLQVDANTAYTLGDAAHLARLDEFDLLLIEQPLGEEDLRQHAELARRIATPVCLDESVVSAQAAADAIALGAAEVINIKPGRVGGYLEAVRIHDLARAHGVPVWCGGMLETGVGRAANAALAGLPGFSLVGDISASDRFYARDITEPLRLQDGHIAIPAGPGFGVEVVPDALEAFTVDVAEVLPA
ncbi:o-succinylbenzoate synthase [Actinotalea sp. M2MS4P-6]|uniref:o-succinylbenzoate synthase n=1 Tax=Actinotalea sp. M2MS4P-6 TaxID=2983762 RepID=UPI0021E40793|nr:o-succinylbenzoate synthase [Actinotalea sp. M2MS4P-6]MCV2395677.1 o-succinylbenzoate synthase [Actinotalea sp. M2MS4P-6]